MFLRMTLIGNADGVLLDFMLYIKTLNFGLVKLTPYVLHLFTVSQYTEEFSAVM